MIDAGLCHTVYKIGGILMFMVGFPVGMMVMALINKYSR